MGNTILKTDFNFSGQTKVYHGKVEMLQDVNTKNIFFTYSLWASEEDLNNYRTSALFAGIWSKTKVLFNEKPMAWSTKKQSEAQ
ncbi:hypothetical protein N9W40_02310 [Flavobacteriales bacterium]|nr:hypothetical protein [Flavobacteriales bacterium]